MIAVLESLWTVFSRSTDEAESLARGLRFVLFCFVLPCFDFPVLVNTPRIQKKHPTLSTHNDILLHAATEPPGRIPTSQNGADSRDLQPPGLLSQAATQGRFSLHTVLNPAENEVSSGQSNTTKASVTDPIQLGYVNLATAESLFSQYGSFLLFFFSSFAFFFFLVHHRALTS